MFLGILSAVTSIFGAVTHGTTGVLGSVAKKVPLTFYAGLVVGSSSPRTACEATQSASGKT